MGTRQYIGARYVPKFANPIDWNNARSYEALEIVNYYGTSYTSKKPVPVGIAITNTEYWVATGNYNAQVEHYRQEVVALRNDISEEMAVKSKKKIIFLGDSYGRISGWPGYAANYLGLSSSEYWDCSADGGRFADGTYILFLNRWLNEHAGEANTIKTIVIAGGINDCSSENYAALTTNLASFRAFVDTNFGSDVEILISFIGWALNTSSILHDRVSQWRRAVKEVMARCSEWGMSYICGMEGVIHNRALLDADGLHPNTDGGKRIGACIANGVKLGCCSVSYYSEGSGVCSPLDGSSAVIEGAIKQVLSEGYVYTSFVNFRITDGSFAFSGGSWVNLCKCELPFSNKLGYMVIPCVIRDSSDNVNKNANLTFIVENDILKARLYEVESGGFISVTADRIYSTYGESTIALIND